MYDLRGVFGVRTLSQREALHGRDGVGAIETVLVVVFRQHAAFGGVRIGTEIIRGGQIR